MHRNLDANFLNVSEEIVTSQAVLDHLGVSEWPLPNFKWLKHLVALSQRFQINKKM